MRTFSTIIGAAVLLFVLFFVVKMATPWFGDYVKDKSDQVSDTLRDELSDEYVSDQAFEDIEREKKSLKEQMVKLTMAKQKKGQLDAELERWEDKLARQEMALTKAVKWLEAHQPGDTVVIAGSSYSYGEIQQDANDRTKRCKNIRLTISGLEDSIKSLNSNLSMAESNWRARLRNIER